MADLDPRGDRLRMAIAHACRAHNTTDPPPEATRGLRQRLTQREDENHVEPTMRIDEFGRPLSLSGQIEVTDDYLHPTTLEAGELKHDQLLLEHEIETELFYSFGDGLSLFRICD